jgi:3-oxoacyl-[acyl-carrier protein] reductase
MGRVEPGRSGFDARDGREFCYGLVMSDLRGRVALITGGDRGLGRSIALAFAGAGMNVAVNHRAAERDAESVVRELEAMRVHAIAVRADVTDASDVTEMVATTRRELGPVDVLVNNAGIARPLPLEQVHVATWDATMAVNLRAPFLITSAVLPEMRARRWGRLLFISSTAARVGGIVGPHYAASKAGLEGLMHSYASTLAKEGITSNAIAPALIETAMLAGNPAATPDRIPVGRFGTPDEVSSIALAIVANGYVTGQTIQVNGGIYMT